MVASAEEEFKRAQDALLLRYDCRAVSRYVTVPDVHVRVHLLEGGAGETVVLLHDAVGAAVGWLPLLAVLEKHFHVIAPDLPGFGLSDKVSYKGTQFRSFAVSLVRSLLQILGVSKSTFIGNGVGGYYSLAFALAHPEWVEKLVMVGAPAGIDQTLPRFLQLLGTPPLNRLLFSTVLAPGPQLTREIFSRMLVANVENVPDAYLDCIHLARCIPGASSSWKSMCEELFTLRGFRKRYLLSRELRELHHPTLFLWGEKDWFAPPSIGRKACKQLRSGQFVVQPSAGHLPWLENPDQTAELVLSFLEDGARF